MPLLTTVGPDDDWEELVAITCGGRAWAEGEDDPGQFQQWAVRLLDLPLRAARLGHLVEHDAPASALSAVRRWTCLRCGAAALAHGTRLYGAALAGRCPYDEEALTLAARRAAAAAGFRSPAEVLSPGE
jgi:hypothetical protein